MLKKIKNLESKTGVSSCHSTESVVDYVYLIFETYSSSKKGERKNGTEKRTEETIGNGGSDMYDDTAVGNDVTGSG